MEKLREDHPYKEGKPVAFVYQQPSHKPSYQLRRIGEGATNIVTGDFEQYVKEVKDVRDQIIFLTKGEIREMLSRYEAGISREMTPDEQQVIMGG